MASQTKSNITYMNRAFHPSGRDGCNPYEQWLLNPGCEVSLEIRRITSNYR